MLEDKCNNCIFLSRKVTLKRRIRRGKLRTTQTGKTRRTLKSSKATSYYFPKNSYLSSLWSINEFQMSSGYDWEAKTSSWGIQIFSSVSRSHDKLLATASVKNSKTEDVVSVLLDIYLLFWEMPMFWKVVMLVNVLIELKVCPPLDGLESVYVKSKRSQAQSSAQRAKQETVNQLHA